MPPGKLIAGFGLPGSGKSSVLKSLSELTGWQIFLEPEEKDWTAAVSQRDQCGNITALTWFRSARVPGLYEADRLRRTGATAIVDSYYDKLVHKYLGKRGMEWLMSPQDKYFSAASEIAHLDYELLPDCDCLVLFKVEKSAWQQMLQRRNRAFDKANPLHDSFETSELFYQAARQYSSEKRTQLIEFDNTISTPLDAAKRLFTLLGGIAA